ncbi:response regulator [Terriglobus roseus]|nr:response regulator transcription factor [Terriglobus roseus]
MSAASRDQTRLLLLDDHLLFREGLVRLLATESEFELVAQCSTVAEALPVLADRRVDLVLLDFDLGNDTGGSLLQAIRTNGYSCNVLLVTAGVSPLEARLLRDAGIGGIFHKQGSPATLLEAIRTVALGKPWLDPIEIQASAHPSHVGLSDRLTTREQEVLRGVFEGLINKQIAIRIGVSESSVKATLQQLFHKTGVRTRSQLVRIALERSLDAQALRA